MVLAINDRHCDIIRAKGGTGELPLTRSDFIVHTESGSASQLHCVEPHYTLSQI